VGTVRAGPANPVTRIIASVLAARPALPARLWFVVGDRATRPRQAEEEDRQQDIQPTTTTCTTGQSSWRRIRRVLPRHRPERSDVLSAMPDRS